MTNVKLTKARMGMLEQLAREPGSYASHYPPMKWALENGYAECVAGRYSDFYRITPAGRAVLRDTKS